MYENLWLLIITLQLWHQLLFSPGVSQPDVTAHLLLEEKKNKHQSWVDIL